MNKPTSMYKLKRVFDLPEKLDLPSCMYKLNNPVACVTSDGDSKIKNQEVLNGIMEKVNIMLKVQKCLNYCTDNENSHILFGVIFFIQALFF